MGGKAKGRSQGQRKRKNEKKRLQEAHKFLIEQQHTVNLSPQKPMSILAVAKKFKVNYYTLRNRTIGKHKDPREAHERQQILSHTQEKVLTEWLNDLSGQCEPVSKRTLRTKVQALTGDRKPGVSWIRRFLSSPTSYHKIRKTLWARSKAGTMLQQNHCHSLL